MSSTKTSERAEILRSAPLNSWIALSDDETKIVATGNSFKEVASKLDAMKDDTAVILKTPSDWLPLAV